MKKRTYKVNDEMGFWTEICILVAPIALLGGIIAFLFWVTT